MATNKKNGKDNSASIDTTATETTVQNGSGDSQDTIRDSQVGNVENLNDSEQVSETSGETTEDPGNDSAAPASDGVTEPPIDPEEVSDPVPSALRHTPGTYEDGSTFKPHVCPNGEVFQLSTSESRFVAENHDGTQTIYSQMTDTLEEFTAFLDQANQASVNPFTGQDEKARLDQGVEGEDPTALQPEPEPTTPATVKVELEYGAYMEAVSWFPKEINQIGGVIHDNSDMKEVYCLVKNEEDFLPEWSSLRKVEA